MDHPIPTERLTLKGKPRAKPGPKPKANRDDQKGVAKKPGRPGRPPSKKSKASAPTSTATSALNTPAGSDAGTPADLNLDDSAQANDQQPQTAEALLHQEENEAEEDDDADEFIMKGSRATATNEEDMEAIRVLMDSFNEAQLKRYEAYRRAHLPKAAVRKLVQSFVGSAVPASVGIIVGGCGKQFIGEIVEGALEVKEEMGAADNLPLTPDNIRESFRRFREKSHSIPNRLYRKRLFS